MLSKDGSRGLSWFAAALPALLLMASPAIAQNNGSAVKLLNTIPVPVTSANNTAGGCTPTTSAGSTIAPSAIISPTALLTSSM